MKEAKSIIVLTAVAAVAAALLSLVNSTTAQTRAQADLDFKLQSLEAVLPQYDNAIAEEAVEVEYEGGKKAVLYPARKAGDLVGVAVELATPPGYGGTVRILVGVDADHRINEFKVLPGHQETPGLGTKVTEDSWRAQFAGKGLDLQGQSWKVKKDDPGGLVDQVTGATITSRAVTEGIHQALVLVDEHAGRFE